MHVTVIDTCYNNRYMLVTDLEYSSTFHSFVIIKYKIFSSWRDPWLLNRPWEILKSLYSLP